MLSSKVELFGPKMFTCTTKLWSFYSGLILSDSDYRTASGGAANDLFGFGLNDDLDTEEEENEEIGKLYRNAIPWNMNLQFTSGYTNAARENNFTNASLGSRR